MTLVEFARDRGFQFLMSNDSVVRMRISDNLSSAAGMHAKPIPGRQSDILVVKEQEMEFDSNNQSIPKRREDGPSNDLRFQIERRMEFDSTRKRMSILVLDPRDNRYKLYVKGADSEI